MGSSQTRDQTRVSCIGRWILNHRTSREALVLLEISTVKTPAGLWLPGLELCAEPAGSDSRHLSQDIGLVWAGGSVLGGDLGWARGG